MKNEDLYRNLESIANSFNAAKRILSIRAEANENRFSNTDSISLISAVLDSLSEYSPSLRQHIGSANNRCMGYCNTYRNLKQYLMSQNSPANRKDRFIQSISLLEPVLDDEKKRMFNKILKIYELFK